MLAALAQDLLCGLDAMHNAKPPMFHRSLHPGNVLLSKLADGRVQYALADWQLGVPMEFSNADSVWLPPELKEVPHGLNWLTDEGKNTDLDAAFDIW